MCIYASIWLHYNDGIKQSEKDDRTLKCNWFYTINRHINIHGSYSPNRKLEKTEVAIKSYQ